MRTAATGTPGTRAARRPSTGTGYSSQPEPADREDTPPAIVPDRPSLAWASCGLTDIGKVRRVNEDALLARPRDCLWLVADGMGGHSRGDLASGDIARAFALMEVPAGLSAFADLAESTLIGLNARLRELADFGRDGTTIGSTVALLLARQAHVLFLWVGDSRIYRSRGGRLEQLTQDHSQVEELVVQGLLRRQDAESHPAANVVTRAVGAADELYVDMDYREVESGDRFLLCSDGLTKAVPEPTIAAILAQDLDPELLCRQLIERALEGGARDNVTAVVVAAQTGQDAP
jgi:serine/threonine protein phosphatase PrpC